VLDDRCLTVKQIEARDLLASDAQHCMLFGGSRSGKTFLLVLIVVVRALLAPGSRHAILRHRFNAVKSSVGMDTLPKVMAKCFPELPYKLDRTLWVMRLPNDSEIWLLGLDEKERTEKVLGQEFATLFFNECSQIERSARDMALTRLAQNVVKTDGESLRLKAYYDCNPPAKSHWTYKIFVARRDPDTSNMISRPEQYVQMRLNPVDNEENLPSGYIASLDDLPARMRLRFRDGEFADDVAGALWRLETIEAYRVTGEETNELPDMVRVVVAVDPSGSGDADTADHDEIGIIVAGLGADGKGYVLEDLTINAGPSTWGNVVGTAYDRNSADCVVAEENFGGAMVRHVIQTARPRTPYRSVRASRGKAVRAEPIAALYEQGRVRHAGHFHKLEDELCGFSTAGFVGSGSPNRADALVWAFSELFSGIVRPAAEAKKPFRAPHVPMGQSWMAS
jgi:hypothetical protein